MRPGKLIHVIEQSVESGHCEGSGVPFGLNLDWLRRMRVPGNDGVTWGWQTRRYAAAVLDRIAVAIEKGIMFLGR